MSVKYEHIVMKDLLDANGDPFTVEQAQSYTHDMWNGTIKSCILMLNRMAHDGIEYEDEEILRQLRSMNTHYRVRSILRVLESGMDIPAIQVLENDGKMYLKDGRHRCWAMILFGKDTIMAEVTTVQ